MPAKVTSDWAAVAKALTNGWGASPPPEEHRPIEVYPSATIFADAE
ncbi:MAG TPA: hypothetical protein K8W18_01385 [Corynebacterium glutamicum]|nr:hypothetical protein [Corynebacterium glutamicum]